MVASQVVDEVVEGVGVARSQPMREVYPNPPVVLVAVEVRHPAAAPLSPADRRKIKSLLGAHVPIMRSARTLLQMTASVMPTGASPPDLQFEEFPRYFSRDKTVAVSIRTEAVVIETTRYTRWENLRALADKVLEARRQVSEIDGVERIGLRYVDEVRIPVLSEEGWGEWVDPSLLGASAIGAELRLTPGPWQGVTAFSSGPETTVVLRYGPSDGYAVDPGGELKRPTPTPGPFFLIDIDSFWAPGQDTPEFDVSAISKICEELHLPVRRVFERVVTDRLREVFRSVAKIEEPV
jgi:uncharacterized protein (TIGR04255 family)